MKDFLSTVAGFCRRRRRPARLAPPAHTPHSMSSLTGLRSPDSDRYTVVEKDEFSSHLPWFNFIATTV